VALLVGDIRDEEFAKSVEKSKSRKEFYGGRAPKSRSYCASLGRSIIPPTLYILEHRMNTIDFRFQSKKRLVT
jgi:hypothetical protein